jgi:transcriptional regulator with XRE-family HTH domain
MALKRRPTQTSISPISAALLAMRKRKGLTQAALAERTGQTQAYVSAVERGSHDLRASTLIAFASALGCEWILVPKNRSQDVLRSVGLTGQPVTPPTLLDEVYVPEPGTEDDDAS